MPGPYHADRAHDVGAEGLAASNAMLQRQLARANARLEGMIRIVASVSLGESSFSEFAKNICNDLEAAFQADVCVLYFVEDFGFRVTGRSSGFERQGIGQTFVPTGTGVPTMVMRNRRSVRMGLVGRDDGDGSAVMVDLSNGTRVRLRSDMASSCSTIMGAPVFSYDRVVAVVLVGWVQPYDASEDDERMLMTVADYLSVELAAMVSQMEQARAASLARSHSGIHDLLKDRSAVTFDLVDKLALRISQAVGSNVIVLVQDHGDATAHTSQYLDGGALGRIDLPYSLDDIFGEEGSPIGIDQSTPCGMWVARHTDLAQGYGIRFAPNPDDNASPSFALLVMRGADDIPFDTVERDFLRRVASDVEMSIKEGRERANEANISKALQMGLRNALPEAKGVTTASLYISATASAMVGGDFFDLYEVSEGHIVVVIGDVSGKGVEAAAMASLVKTSLAAYAWDYLEPAQMLTSLNNLFLNFSRLETFASMIVVSIDLDKREATYCSGGHPPAMVVHGPSTPRAELELLTEQSPIVGAFEDMEYVDGSFRFEKGDILYLYTDGTTEARKPSGEFFGEDNLRIALLKASAMGVEAIPSMILSAVEDFACGELHDDIGMVALRFD